jgi:subtilisin family serine protease
MGLVRLSAVAAAAFALGAGPAAAAVPAKGAASTPTGAPVVVAVVDSGVQADHPALASRLLPGWNFVANDGDTSDDYGHGTAVAGIVASAESAGEIPGACSQCRILPVKVLDAHGVGDWGTVAEGIRWAADHGAQVINLSFGAAHVPDVLGAAVGYAISKGAIVVAAAGNDGRNESFYPAAYPNVVSVAGVDAGEARYPWSNFGSQVTVAAPGCATTASLGGGYRSDFCGTSAAAPFVAGLAALVLSCRPTLGEAEFTTALVGSGVPLADPTTAAHGAVDAARLLAAVGVPEAPPAAAARPSLGVVPRVGRKIAAAAGSWKNAAVVAYAWERSRDGRSWQPVGAGPTYTPRAADRGYRLRLVAVATNARGRTEASSDATAPVTVAAAAQSARRPRG